MFLTEQYCGNNFLGQGAATGALCALPREVLPVVSPDIAWEPAGPRLHEGDMQNQNNHANTPSPAF